MNNGYKMLKSEQIILKQKAIILNLNYELRISSGELEKLKVENSMLRTKARVLL
jgi:hypothetical protein